MTTVHADVVVVGAGLAGLAAARRLQHAGRNIAVLEARERVGGRVHSIRTASGAIVDLGAQWIGPGQDRMYGLTKSYGIDVVATHKTGKHVFDLGRGAEVTRREVPPLPFLGLLDAMQIGLRLDRAARSTSSEEPWLRPSADKYDRETALEWIERAAYTKAGGAFWSALAEGATCADPSSSSALDLIQQTRSIGGLAALGTAERDYMANGAQSLVNCIAKELVGMVELATPVQLVEYRTDGVRVVSGSDAWDARRVVIAVPLCLLDTIVFKPSLPEPRRSVTRHVVRVHVIKSVVVYDRPYWREEDFSGIAFSVPGPTNTVLDASPPAGGVGVLVTLAAGRLATALGALPPDRRRETVVSHLARCFPVLVGKAPAEYLECNWSEEEWSGGGYASRLGPGAWGSIGRALRDPVGPIHWAGTELAVEWRSYMEGAVRSGERAADEILAAT